MIATFTKAPAENLDYDIDFSQWLPDGDVITSVDATVSPIGELTVTSSQITDQLVKVWTAGGVDGSSYTVTVAVGTSGGRVKEVCFKIRVKDC